MKFFAKNKNIALITIYSIIILSIINLCNLQKLAKKDSKNEDDIPTVAPLTPAANLAIKAGNKFCSKNCVTNFSERTKSCLLGKKLHDCKRCSINPKMKNDKSKKTICESLCNGILPSKPCMFFGYFDGKLKKNVNKAILDKFKLKLIRRK